MSEYPSVSAASRGMGARSPAGDYCSSLPSSSWIRGFIDDVIRPFDDAGWTAAGDMPTTDSPWRTALRAEDVPKVDAAVRLLASQASTVFAGDVRSSRWSVIGPPDAPTLGAMPLATAPMRFRIGDGLTTEWEDIWVGAYEALLTEVFAVAAASIDLIPIAPMTEEEFSYFCFRTDAWNAFGLLPFGMQLRTLVPAHRRPLVGRAVRGHPVRQWISGRGALGSSVRALCPRLNTTGSFVFPLEVDGIYAPTLAVVRLVEMLAQPGLPALLFTLPAGRLRDLSGELTAAQAAGLIPSPTAAVALMGFDLGLGNSLKPLTETIGKLPNLDGVGKALPWVLISLTTVLGIVPSPVPFAFLLGLVESVTASEEAKVYLAALQGSLDEFGTALWGLSQPGVLPNESLALFLDGYRRVTELHEDGPLALFGMQSRDAERFVQYLSPVRTFEGFLWEPLLSIAAPAVPGVAPTEVPYSGWPTRDFDDSATLRPVFHLADRDLDFDFEEFASRKFPQESPIIAVETWTYGDWLTKAWPAIQFADILDLATRLYELAILSEGIWFFTARLAALDGSLGTQARSGALVELVSVLGDVPLSRLVAFLWRQQIADTFVNTAPLSGFDGAVGDRSCLWELFCWMATPERRAVLDDVLGPVQRPEEGDALWTRTGGILQELLGTSLTGMAERFRTLSPTAGGSCEARHAAWFAFLDLVRMDCGSTREAWFVSKKKGVDITNATSPFA